MMRRFIDYARGMDRGVFGEPRWIAWMFSLLAIAIALPLAALMAIVSWRLLLEVAL